MPWPGVSARCFEPGATLDMTSSQDSTDAGTTDFLTGLMEQHERMAWMLRTILQGKN